MTVDGPAPRSSLDILSIDLDIDLLDRALIVRSLRQSETFILDALASCCNMEDITRCRNAHDRCARLIELFGGYPNVLRRSKIDRAWDQKLEYP